LFVSLLFVLFALAVLLDSPAWSDLDRDRGVYFTVGGPDRQRSVVGEGECPSAFVDQVVVVFTDRDQVA
jgi:hypothetical protein